MGEPRAASYRSSDLTLLGQVGLVGNEDANRASITDILMHLLPIDCDSEHGAMMGAVNRHHDIYSSETNLDPAVQIV